MLYEVPYAILVFNPHKLLELLQTIINHNVMFMCIVHGWVLCSMYNNYTVLSALLFLCPIFVYCKSMKLNILRSIP